MLLMFRVKNFASFKDEVVLDMRAMSYKDMKEHVIERGNSKALKTMAVFGKNASGKSNLISAIFYFKSFIYNQFFNHEPDESDNNKIGRVLNVKRNRFRLSEQESKESEFEILFNHKDNIYQYGFIVADMPDEKSYVIKEEWLLYNDKTVFERDKNKLTFGKKYLSELTKIEKCRDDRLYIGVLDYFATGTVKEIVDSFKEYLKNGLNIHFELFLEASVKGVVSNVSYSRRLIEDPEYRNEIEKFIRFADVGIEGLSIRNSSDDGEDDSVEVYTIHNVYDEKGEIVGQEEFEMSMESSGTIRYFSFIQYVLNIMEEGGTFIVDEMSARLHPILVKFIVDLFQSEKNKNAQLIFTTHDVGLMDRRQFRRDEIAFVDKDRKGVSSFYTLADIRVRSDASFAKDYMAGKYGAVPVLDSKVAEGLVSE